MNAVFVKKSLTKSVPGIFICEFIRGNETMFARFVTQHSHNRPVWNGTWRYTSSQIWAQIRERIQKLEENRLYCGHWNKRSRYISKGSRCKICFNFVFIRWRCATFSIFMDDTCSLFISKQTRSSWWLKCRCFQIKWPQICCKQNIADFIDFRQLRWFETDVLAYKETFLPIIFIWWTLPSS